MADGVRLLADSACVNWTQYSIPISASLFSQLAGVLAGFAFVAITMVISRDHRRRSDPSPGAQITEKQDAAFIAGAGCAFIGLIATSTLYATIAAQERCLLVAQSGGSVEVLAGVAFAFSVYSLLYSLVQLASSAPVGNHLRGIVAVAAPPVVVLFAATALTDFALTFADPPTQQSTDPRAPIQPQWRGDDQQFWEWTRTATGCLVAGVFTTCGAIYVICAKYRRHQSQHHSAPAAQSRVARIGAYLPYGSLILVAYAAVRTASFPILEPAASISVAEAVAVVGLSTLLIVIQSAFLSIFRSVD